MFLPNLLHGEAFIRQGLAGKIDGEDEPLLQLPREATGKKWQIKSSLTLIRFICAAMFINQPDRVFSVLSGSTLRQL